MKPTIYVLVGLPGSGKSTWVEEFERNGGDAVVISSDRLLEAYARENNTTYNEAHRVVDMREINAILREKCAEAVAARRDIIDDRTNLTCASRRRSMGMIPKHYRRVAVFFDIDDRTVDCRVRERKRRTGKHIPRAVMENFRNILTPPTLEEFDEIIRVGK